MCLLFLRYYATCLTDCYPYSTPTEILCRDGDIRLVGGNNSNEGEVKLCYDGEWRAVCDDRWDNREARVVCKQLGYSGEQNFLKPYYRVSRPYEGMVLTHPLPLT